MEEKQEERKKERKRERERERERERSGERAKRRVSFQRTGGPTDRPTDCESLSSSSSQLHPLGVCYWASVVIQRLSYLTETVLSNKITRNRIVPSFKNSPREPLGRRPTTAENERTTERESRLASASVRGPHFPGQTTTRRVQFLEETIRLTFLWRFILRKALRLRKAKNRLRAEVHSGGRAKRASAFRKDGAVFRVTQLAQPRFSVWTCEIWIESAAVQLQFVKELSM